MMHFHIRSWACCAAFCVGAWLPSAGFDKWDQPQQRVDESVEVLLSKLEFAVGSERDDLVRAICERGDSAVAALRLTISRMRAAAFGRVSASPSYARLVRLAATRADFEDLRNRVMAALAQRTASTQVTACAPMTEHEFEVAFRTMWKLWERSPRVKVTAVFRADLEQLHWATMTWSERCMAQQSGTSVEWPEWLDAIDTNSEFVDVRSMRLTKEVSCRSQLAQSVMDANDLAQPRHGVAWRGPVPGEFEAAQRLNELRVVFDRDCMRWNRAAYHAISDVATTAWNLCDKTPVLEGIRDGDLSLIARVVKQMAVRGVAVESLRARVVDLPYGADSYRDFAWVSSHAAHVMTVIASNWIDGVCVFATGKCWIVDVSLARH